MRTVEAPLKKKLWNHLLFSPGPGEGEEEEEEEEGGTEKKEEKIPSAEILEIFERIYIIER